MAALQLGLPTLLLIAAYLAGINLLGARLGRGQKDARDYFLGSHAMPWGAVLGSIVATETSALTFLSVPGDAYTSGYTFLQLVLGYVVGRIARRVDPPARLLRARVPHGLRASRSAIRRARAALHVAALHGHARARRRRAPRGAGDPDRLPAAHPGLGRDPRCSPRARRSTRSSAASRPSSGSTSSRCSSTSPAP